MTFVNLNKKKPQKQIKIAKQLVAKNRFDNYIFEKLSKQRSFIWQEVFHRKFKNYKFYKKP